VSRPAKGQEFDSTKGRTFHPIYLTERTIKGTWGNLEKQKENGMISINGLRLMDHNWSQHRTLKISYLIIVAEKYYIYKKRYC
jgi:hypothetical protein